MEGIIMSQSISQPASPTSQLKFEDLHLGLRCQSPSQTRLEQDDEATKTFHYFTHLPTELRLKIYALCLPQPRLVPIYYLSPTAFSPSPPLSPSRLTSSHSPHKRICCSSITNSPPHTITNKAQIGLTSPATIPSLLHLCQESRALATQHYTLSFRLSGPEVTFPAKIWFSTSAGGESEQDILYFPTLSHTGYLASFKHWTNILSVLPSSTFQSITRLAVHEDLFLEERKRRSSQDSGLAWEGGYSMGNTLTWGNVERWENEESWRRESDGGIWGNGGMAGNGFREGWGNSAEDSIAEDRLRDFWRDVRRRFRGVVEVWIVGDGREADILSLSSPYNPSSQAYSSASSSMSGSGCGVGWWDAREEDMLTSINSSINMMVCSRNFKGRETFEEKVARVVCEVVAESGNMWRAPRWRVLGERGGSVVSSPY